MRKEKRSSVQLEEEFHNGENRELRESELWKVKKQEEPISSW